MSDRVSIPHRYGKNDRKNRTNGTLENMFPFLIGTVRTIFAVDVCETVKKVSIPHRYGKNSNFLVKLQYRDVVSIPHRYGKNFRMFAHELKEPMFPFLIGTVRTKIQEFLQNITLDVFPFLIGTVRTIRQSN